MIELNQVTKVYPNHTKALNNVDLKIDEGEFVFIVGASGSGKTTLTKILLCEEDITSGSLTVGNYKLEKIKKRQIPYLRRTIGIVFQDFRLLPKMTVFDNVAFAMRVVGEPTRVIKKRVMRFLKLVNLEEKAYSFPHQLSGGQKQRVAIARALVNNPEIIIADEPTGNIDPLMTVEMMELLLKIHQLGKTVLVITHNRDIVDYYNKRVVVLTDGVISADRVGGMFDEV
jgi:cell division transport system ATP-binding protein